MLASPDAPGLAYKHRGNYFRFALRQMLSSGWVPGVGLGKRENGKLYPVVATGVRTKLDKSGFGFIPTDVEDQIPTNFEGLSSLSLNLAGRPVVVEPMQNFVTASLFDEEVSFEEIGHKIKAEIWLEILGNKIRCLIDTGSEVSCISEELFEWLQSRGDVQLPSLPVKPIQIRGAVGQKSLKIQQLCSIEIKIQEVIFDTGLLVVPRLTVPVILGFDWLLSYKAIITLQDPRSLILEMKGGRITVPFIEEDQRIAAIRSLQLENDGEANHEVCEVDFLDRIKAGIELTVDMRKSLKQILEAHRIVFTKRIGRANCYTHHISMHEHVPRINRSYPIPYAYRSKVEDKLQEMVDMGIISRGSTPYSSPLTFTSKTDGTIRILLDAREINKYMVAESEAPPMQIDILNAFHGVKYITIIDLNNAYFQIPISETSRQYTGFTVNGKSYMYNVLPQGLKTSVGSFSRAMDVILGPSVRSFCVNYLDDLAILTDGQWEDHLEQIDLVLERLERAGLTCNLEKCKFACQEVKMLGHIVSTEGIRTDPAKVESIQKFPTPKKVKHVRAFLGLCNYYRRFIPNYSSLIVPLTKLLKKGQSWYWDEELDKAFWNLKQEFSTTILLSHPDVSKPYYLQTDSSGVGIAGVLYQYDEKGEIRILSFCSRSLRGSELRWTVTEQEFWAIIYGIKKFETYLRGAELIIRTDHKALVFVKNIRLYNSRITRWILYLEQFNYTVEHVKGTENIGVDILSRFPNDGEIQEGKLWYPSIMYMGVQENKELQDKLGEMAQLQDRDNVIRGIKNRLSNPGLEGVNDRLARIASRCITENGILYFNRLDSPNRVLYLPEILQAEVCRQVHLELGHLGVYKMIKYLQDRFYWLKMRETIRDFVRSCHLCQLSKIDNIKYVGTCKSIISENPGDLVMADLYGPLPISRGGISHIFVIQDSFTKYIKLYGLKAATARAVVSRMRDFALTIKPKKVMTDRGRQFIGDVWRLGLRGIGVKTIYTSIRNPRPNTAEVVNKQLGKFFRIYCHEQHRSWGCWLKKIEELYNNTLHLSTGFTPNEVLSGNSTQLSIDRSLINFTKNKSVNEIREQVRVNLRSASKKRQDRFNKNHNLIQYQIGDLVKVRRLNKSDSLSGRIKKFELIYDGPYIVADRYYENVYVLVHPETLVEKGLFNAVHLARYYV